MRIIAGLARGRRLQTLEGNEVRPTAERVKEAVFSILQFRIEGRSFLDLFSGSGQMGLEALSRGAKKAVMVDASKASVGVMQKNAQTVNLPGAVIVPGEAAGYLLRCREKFDIAFLDPPYRTGMLQAVLPQVAGCMQKTGVILCEHPAEEELPEQVGDFLKKKVYRYGQVSVSLYEQETEA